MSIFYFFCIFYLFLVDTRHTHTHTHNTQKTLSVDEQLKVILFGEAVLNDAAAVVINRVFVSISDDERTAVEALAPALPLIVGVACASMVLGMVCGLTAAFIHKHSRMDKYPHIEFAAFLLGFFFFFFFFCVCVFFGGNEFVRGHCFFLLLSITTH